MKKEDEILFYDSPEKINQCLNCIRPKCTNCLRIGGKGYSLERDKIDYGEFMELYENNWTDSRIADYFGVKTFTIANYRKTLSLPSKQPQARRNRHARS